VRQWRTISYGYLVTRRNFELRLPFSIDIHSTDAHGDLPTRQRKAAALQKTVLNRHPPGCPLDVDHLTEGQIMPLLSILRDHSFKRLVQGAAVGAVATMIIGFNWGGWSIESTAAKRADEASRTAVVAVLAPICVDRFQHSADATNNFIELKKVSTYMQGSFVEKGGWATSPGSDKANSAVAQACATMLGNLK
jgi:hypothetical protein